MERVGSRKRCIARLPLWMGIGIVVLVGGFLAYTHFGFEHYRSRFGSSETTGSGRSAGPGHCCRFRRLAAVARPQSRWCFAGTGLLDGMAGRRTADSPGKSRSGAAFLVRRRQGSAFHDGSRSGSRVHRLPGPLARATNSGDSLSEPVRRTFRSGTAFELRQSMASCLMRSGQPASCTVCTPALARKSGDATSSTNFTLRRCNTACRFRTD